MTQVTSEAKQATAADRAPNHATRMPEFTRAELEFLLNLLENVQLSGTADQVRAVLKLRDGALDKLKALQTPNVTAG